MKIDVFIDKSLFSTLSKISETDIIIKRIIDKDYKDMQDLTNSLSAAIVCLYYRETSFQLTIHDLLQSNPQIKTILEAKNDSNQLPIT